MPVDYLNLKASQLVTLGYASDSYYKSILLISYHLI